MPPKPQNVKAQRYFIPVSPAPVVNSPLIAGESR